MTGKRHRENRGGREIVAKIYWCRAYHMLGKIGCQGQTIYETFVKKVMVPVVIDLLQNHIRLDDALREAAEEMASPSLGTKREQYNAELAQIALAQERLVDAVAQGLFQPEEVRRKQMELREKKEYAEKRLANLDRNQEASTEIAEALRLVEGDLSDLLENAPDIQLQRLCQLVFRSFSIEGEGIAKQRKGKLVAYEFTPEFQELLAASTPNTHAPALLIEWCGARKGR